MVNAADNDIDLSIVEQIAKGRPSPWNNFSQACAKYCRHNLKFFATYAMEQKRTLCKRRAPIMLVGLWIDMSIDQKNVFPAVIVVIDKLRRPCEKRISNCRNPHLRADFAEACITYVLKEGLIVIGKCSCIKVDQTIILIVADRQAHA